MTDYNDVIDSDILFLARSCDIDLEQHIPHSSKFSNEEASILHEISGFHRDMEWGDTQTYWAYYVWFDLDRFNEDDERMGWILRTDTQGFVDAWPCTLPEATHLEAEYIAFYTCPECEEDYENCECPEPRGF